MPSYGPIDIQSLESAFRGELFRPGDAGYDQARRIWNASVNKHPAVIARCAGVADIVSAVRFAREKSLLTRFEAAVTMWAAALSATTES